MPIKLVFPGITKNRGIGYWLRPRNLWASRRKLRSDHSNQWRYTFHGSNPPNFERSTPFAKLLGRPVDQDGFRFLIIGDPGEGDHSQYSLVPVIRHLKPHFMIINGDVVYPAGRDEDFVDGFYQPYQGLDMPIWAVPGNHEYYSPNKGREFFEVFCTRNQASRWARHRLRLVPQPSTYWELCDPSGLTKLVIIGLDSGQSADLDGNGRGKSPDNEQHQWLWWRLQEARNRGDSVIVLFHIPALVRAKHIKKTGLGTIHRILASFPCVKLVVCGHEHNYQEYLPQTFGDYLAREHKAPHLGHAFPHYVVSGHGGATIGHTDFKIGRYPTHSRFPTPQQWKDHFSLGVRMVARYLGKSIVGRIAGVISKGAAADRDYHGLLSFLYGEARSGLPTEVSVFCMDDLRELYDVPDNATVLVEDPTIPLKDAEVRKRMNRICLV